MGDRVEPAVVEVGDVVVRQLGSGVHLELDPGAAQRGAHLGGALADLVEGAGRERVARVRGDRDDAGAVRDGHARERHGRAQIHGAVVDPGEQVEVELGASHGCLLP